MKTIKRTKEMPKDAKYAVKHLEKTVYYTEKSHLPTVKIFRQIYKITDKPTRKQLKARITELEEKEKKVKEFLGKYSMNDLIKAITKNTCLHEKSKLISSMKNSNENEVNNMYSCKHCDEAIHEVLKNEH